MYRCPSADGAPGFTDTWSATAMHTERIQVGQKGRDRREGRREDGLVCRVYQWAVIGRHIMRRAIKTCSSSLLASAQQMHCVAHCSLGNSFSES